ncbi:hypothetical protein MHYP_G00246910 [Metynnis hypsauchen]
MEDGPNRTDNMVLTGMAITNEQRTLRKCSCGWSNVTTHRGLRIHQGKAKCGGTSQMQSCTALADQTSRRQSQVEHHSATVSNIAYGQTEEEHLSQQQEQLQHLVPTPHNEYQEETPSSETPSQTRKERPIRQPKVRWPKASDKEAWRSFDQDLHIILGKSLQGSVTTKLNLFGNIIYEEGKERFGERTGRKSTPREPGRREREIHNLVKERRSLRKAWRKAGDSEKEGLKALWAQIRTRLATLRRAERIRKRRSRKEKERAKFFQDPFKFARSLLEEKKNGKLEATAQELEEYMINQLSDHERNIPLGSPGHVPRPAEPESQFDTTPPRQMGRGVRSQSGHRLPALRSYMDDVTSLLQTAPCTARLLKRFEELLGWARMRIKPSKSRSLSILKGARNDLISFAVDGERIPLLAEQPVRSLGRLYTADLSDTHMPATIMQQLTDGLGRIDKSYLPGLFGRNILQLPLKSIDLGYKQEKARLVLELRDSTDPFVKNNKASVRTGRKWRAEEAVDQAISRLMHKEVVGRTQSGRAGLGWGTATKFWSKASKKERKQLVIEEVVRSEEDLYKIKALSQPQQGQWTTWEGVVNRTIKWSDMWKMPQARLSFLIRATYDTLPSPSNLSQWYGSDESCHLCNAPNPSLQHILSSCKTALAQGRYRWRHDQVLRKLAEVLEDCISDILYQDWLDRVYRQNP